MNDSCRWDSSSAGFLCGHVKDETADRSAIRLIRMCVEEVRHHMAQKKTTSAKTKPAKAKSAASAAVKRAAPASSSKSRGQAAAKTTRGTSSKSVASAAKGVKAKSPAAKPKAAKPAAKKPAAAKPAKPVKSAKAAASKPAAKKTAQTKASAAKAAASKTKVSKATAPKAVAASKSKKPVAAKPSAAKPAATKAAKPARGAAKPAKASTAAKSAGGRKKAAPKIAPPPSAPAKVATGAAAKKVAASIAEAAARKISSPVKPLKTAKSPADKSLSDAVSAQSKKPVSQRHGFKTNEHVVYPAHGVGRIIAIEEEEIAGMALELFVIHFDKEKLTLRVPTGKLESVGLRKLAETEVVDKGLAVLKGRARVKRTMWSRRAQEYIAKINSGDLISIAEVVRDLYRSEAQPEQSYSERQLYEDALDRMAREVAAVYKLDERGAIQRITDVLSKSARSRREAGEADGDATQAA